MSSSSKPTLEELRKELAALLAMVPKNIFHAPSMTRSDWTTFSDSASLAIGPTHSSPQGAPEVKYTCPLPTCGMDFVLKRSFTRHMRSKHPFDYYEPEKCTFRVSSSCSLSSSSLTCTTSPPASASSSDLPIFAGSTSFEECAVPESLDADTHLKDFLLPISSSPIFGVLPMHESLEMVRCKSCCDFIRVSACLQHSAVCNGSDWEPHVKPRKGRKKGFRKLTKSDAELVILPALELHPLASPDSVFEEFPVLHPQTSPLPASCSPIPSPGSPHGSDVASDTSDLSDHSSRSLASDTECVIEIPTPQLALLNDLKASDPTPSRNRRFTSHPRKVSTLRNTSTIDNDPPCILMGSSVGNSIDCGSRTFRQRRAVPYMM